VMFAVSSGLISEATKVETEIDKMMKVVRKSLNICIRFFEVDD